MQYVYRCPRCGHETDIEHMMSEDPVIVCNICQETMKRKPQPFLWGWASGDRIMSDMDSEYVKYRGRKRRNGN